MPKLNATDYTYSVTKTAICNTTGTGRYTWKTTTYGTFSFDVTIPKTAHSYKDTVTAPTCTAQGYTSHTCSVCGDSYKDTYTNALGHSYSYAVTTAPTTSAAGTLTGTCSRCSGTTAVALPKLNTTDYNYSVTKAASCTAEGTGRYIWKTTTYGTYTFDAAIPKTAHSYQDVVTAPTCTEQGYTTHTCSVCSDSYKDSYTEALGHAWDEGTVTKEPTATQTGEKTFTCARCRQTRIEVIPVTTHTHSYTAETVAPTCTAQGYTLHTCACGDSYKDAYVAAQGHSFGKWAATKPAACGEAGEEQRTCERCGETETRSIDALEHDYTDSIVAPGCEEAGFTVHTCARCGDSYTDTYTEALGHDYGYAVTDEPTADRPGTLTGTCTRCGSTVNASLPRFNETDYTYQVVREPTCAAPGAWEYTWKVTDYGTFTFNVPVAQSDHTYEESVTAPTCTEYGYTTYTCAVCGGSYKDNYTEALGHDWGEGTVTKEPTQTEAGVRTYTCSRCNETRTEAIPPLAHEHSYSETVIDPTCVRSGYTLYQCECGSSYIDDYVSALGHVWDEGTVTKEPTETEEGVRTFTCTRCGETKIELIPAQEHSHAYEAVVTAPTCTEAGFTTYTCECGESYVDDEVPALGHDFVDGVCTRCGEKDTTPEPFRFDDVRDESKFYFDPVYWAFNAKPQITNGLTATTFGPDAGCTRGQVVTFLWRAAGCPEPDSTETGFTDLKDGGFYRKAVAWAVEQGITKGISTTTFAPDATCTRGQIVTFLWRFRGEAEPRSTETAFTDVSESAFYARAVAWAVENKITNGMTNTTFDPDGTCTRGQIVTFLYRAMNG